MSDIRNALTKTEWGEQITVTRCDTCMEEWTDNREHRHCRGLRPDYFTRADAELLEIAAAFLERWVPAPVSDATHLRSLASRISALLPEEEK